MLLRSRGDIDGAEAALRRAEERGNAEATIQLAFLLEDDRGDLAGAESALRRADGAGSAFGSMMLGVMLRGRGADREAVETFLRAEERGHEDAAASIGSILEDAGDLAGAEAAYSRADERGSVLGAFNLGLLLMNGGDLDGAQAAWQNADERGDAEGAANLGSLLRERGDDLGAQAAYQRADERGSPLGSWQLGEMLEAQGQLPAAQAAYERAADRGSPPGAFALARVHLLNEDVSAARAALVRASDLGHTRAPELLDDLERLEPCQAPATRELFRAAESDERIAAAKVAYDQGLRLADAGRFGEARDALTEAAALCARLELGDECAMCELQLSHSVHMAAGDLQQARSAGQRAVAGFEATGNQHGRAQAAMVLGVVSEESGEADRAIELYELTTAIGEAPMADRALLMKGRVLKNLGKPAEARGAFLNALAVAEAKGDAEAIADNKRELGIVCEHIDGPEIAERYHVEAAAVFADLNQPRDVADCEANLGVLYANTERFEAAEHHMMNARQAYEELGLDERVARTLRHLGNVYRNTKRPVLSRQINERALEINERTGNWVEVAHCTRNIGAALNMQRDYAGAEMYFLKARDHFRRLRAPAQEANCEDLLRVLYTHLGRAADAEACATRSAEAYSLITALHRAGGEDDGSSAASSRPGEDETREARDGRASAGGPRTASEPPREHDRRDARAPQPRDRQLTHSTRESPGSNEPAGHAAVVGALSRIGFDVEAKDSMVVEVLMSMLPPRAHIAGCARYVDFRASLAHPHREQHERFLRPLATNLGPSLGRGVLGSPANPPATTVVACTDEVLLWTTSHFEGGDGVIVEERVTGHSIPLADVLGAAVRKRRHVDIWVHDGPTLSFRMTADAATGLAEAVDIGAATA